MKIFLAAPFTDQIDIKLGHTNDKFTSTLMDIINYLRVNGHHVISAHEREEWGLDLDSPEEAINLDFQGVENSDAIVAIIGSPPSPGVQMELGVALTKKIPIICLYKKGQFIPYLVKGMHTLTQTIYIEYTSLNRTKNKILKSIISLQFSQPHNHDYNYM